MGAAASSAGDRSRGRGTQLGDLPESCVAEVLLRLDPPEICRMARVSRTFRGAASGDGVWKAKLPHNYTRLLAIAAAGNEEEETNDGNKQSVLRLLEAAGAVAKKELYARLCRCNRFDGGTKEFWLDKSGGGVCMSISSKALSITGIDDRRYWNFLPTDESRFHSVAYLIQIWWLEVQGETEFCFPRGTYSVFFRVHLGRPSRRLGRRVCRSEHVHGWDAKPVRFHLSTSDGQRAQSKCYLAEPGVWTDHHVGDFRVAEDGAPVSVRFSMVQIDCTHTKGGLCVDSVLIRAAPHATTG